MKREVREVIKRVGLVGVHKATGRMEIVVMKPDLDMFLRAVLKAKEVFEMKSPFEVGVNREECGDCEFVRECW